MPFIYFEHLISKLGVQVNSVREAPHKQQPCYKSTTRRILYKMFDSETLFLALEEQGLVELKTEVMFAGNTPCPEDEETSSSSLTAEGEIARAKQSVYRLENRRRPSSKSLLVVGLGEGQATREVEIIWWPELYRWTRHGQMTVRFFIQNCEF